jgi:hypothetical protein
VNRVIFIQAAQREVIAALDWYEGEMARLGERFRKAPDAVVSRVADDPRQFPIVSKNVHRALLRRFPYCLFLVVEGESLFVRACFHA